MNYAISGQSLPHRVSKNQRNLANNTSPSTDVSFKSATQSSKANPMNQRVIITLLLKLVQQLISLLASPNQSNQSGSDKKASIATQGNSSNDNSLDASQLDSDKKAGGTVAQSDSSSSAVASQSDSDSGLANSTSPAAMTVAQDDVGVIRTFSTPTANIGNTFPNPSYDQMDIENLAEVKGFGVRNDSSNGYEPKSTPYTFRNLNFPNERVVSGKLVLRLERRSDNIDSQFSRPSLFDSVIITENKNRTQAAPIWRLLPSGTQAAIGNGPLTGRSGTLEIDLNPQSLQSIRDNDFSFFVHDNTKLTDARLEVQTIGNTPIGVQPNQ